MKAEQISSIKILKQNKFYRIADLFYRDGNRWEHDRKEILKTRFTKTQYYTIILVKKQQNLILIYSKK